MSRFLSPGVLTLGLILLASIGLGVSSADAQEFAPGCNTDLAAVDESFGETLDRLATASTPRPTTAHIACWR